MDKYIGQVILVELPNSKSRRYRWIVRKRDDNRYIVRIPRTGVLLKELKLKRSKDFGAEVLLPIGTKPFDIKAKIKLSKKTSKKNIKKTI
jgi:hypothetical protein